MKRFLTFALLAFMLLYGLSDCGCVNGENADLVFVNGSDSAIVAVAVDFEDQNSEVRHADSSPLKKGETFGFEVGDYPVTVMAYNRPFENIEQKELGSITIPEAPPEGERWYVTAKDSGTGLIFTVDTEMPEGV